MRNDRQTLTNQPRDTAPHVLVDTSSIMRCVREILPCLALLARLSLAWQSKAVRAAAARSGARPGGASGKSKGGRRRRRPVAGGKSGKSGRAAARDAGNAKIVDRALRRQRFALPDVKDG